MNSQVACHPKLQSGAKGGGAEETRTPDPHDANVVLYQLSYRPKGMKGPRK